MRGYTYINIVKLTTAFRRSYGQSFRHLFLIYPSILAIILLLSLQGNYSNVSEVTNGFLTSFIPIFATIFSIYTSWAFTAAKSRHAAERYQLIEETCAAILFLIPLDLLALTFSVLSEMTIGGNVILFDVCNKAISIQTVLSAFTHYIYYFLLVDIAFVTLTIVKRSYILLTNEIALLRDNPTTITKEQFDVYYDIAVALLVKTYSTDVQRQKTDELMQKKQEVFSEVEETTKDEAFSSYLFVNMILQLLQQKM